MKNIKAALTLPYQARKAAIGIATALAIAVSAPTALAQGWGVVDSGKSKPVNTDEPAPVLPGMTPPQYRFDQSFHDVISQVLQMPSDSDLQSRANRYGLNVVNVMWEDTGRYAGSSVGPNISDLTLQVREPVNGGVQTHLLPVIRHPNFSDKTADVNIDKMWIKVGNQYKGKAVAVPLKEVLRYLPEYLSNPRSIQGKAKGNMLADRDSHVLVSAQHVFVPIPKAGKAEFNPVLYNYQSSTGNPAVMTLLVTRQGMSATVIENRAGDQDQQQWGQQLFFNNGGQKTVFTAERFSDVKARIDSGKAQKQDEGALEEGSDMMMIIQIPLKHRAPVYNYGGCYGCEYEAFDDADMAPMAKPSAAGPVNEGKRVARSDVEKAVIGHGEDMGPFVEGNNLELERDDRFPIRVTVQFYKATSNGVVSAQDLEDANRQIEKVYQSGDFVGSLVVGNGSHTRPTDWQKGRTPTSWWK